MIVWRCGWLSFLKLSLFYVVLRSFYFYFFAARSEGKCVEEVKMLFAFDEYDIVTDKVFFSFRFFSGCIFRSLVKVG